MENKGKALALALEATEHCVKTEILTLSLNKARSSRVNESDLAITGTTFTTSDNFRSTVTSSY